MGEDGERVIVVGVDGSEPSLDALRWAARQAELTGAKLRAVISWEIPTTYGWAPAFPSDYDPEADARRVVNNAVELALGSERTIEVETEVVEGHPAPSLLEASKDAELLVVGSRGHGAFAGMVIGSVSEHCTAHAECPVVVVRHSSKLA